MLTNVSFAVYKQGRLIRGALVGNMTYEEADEMAASLERDYPGCVVVLGEF